MTPEALERRRAKQREYAQRKRREAGASVRVFYSEQEARERILLRKRESEMRKRREAGIPSRTFLTDDEKQAMHREWSRKTFTKSYLAKQLCCDISQVPDDLLNTKLAILSVKRKVKELMK